MTCPGVLPLLCHLLLRDEELSVAEVAKHMGTGHAIDLSAIHHEEQCPTMGRVEESWYSV